MFYRRFNSIETLHFGILKRNEAGGWGVLSKFGPDGPVFLHGIHCVPLWYGTQFSIRRPPLRELMWCQCCIAFCGVQCLYVLCFLQTSPMAPKSTREIPMQPVGT